MAPAADRLAAMSESQRRQLESLLLDFEVAWTAEALAGRVDKLPSQDQDYRQVALLELIRIDLERQWQVGNRRGVEDYQQRFPELGTRESVAAELLLAEYQARQLSGAPAELNDFARRFPQQIERLEQLLQQSSATAASQVSRAAHTNTSRAGEMVETQAEPTAKSWSLPMEFGRYRILKPLGAGGMGSVFLAHDTELDRQVAIKTPKFAGGEDPQLIERFYREARAAARLQNRHICPVYDVGEIDGVRYISMAYIEGRPLSTYIRSDRTQPQRSVVLVVGRLARALQEAHAQGIVHRDLKPSNIMIDGKREPVIMDFGLARDLDRQGDSRLTQSGMVLGTPAYMAPEQVSGESDQIGPPSDIYSLGVILYELLTGRVPFEGSMAAVLGRVMTQQPPRPSEYRADVDPRLEQICLKMMAKRVKDRYANMQEVAEALVDFLKEPIDAGLEEDASAGVMTASPDENQQLEEMFATQYARNSSGPLARIERDAAPRPTASPWNWLRRPPVAVGIAAGALALVLFGVLILLRTPHGTLRIEVDDPQLIVSVDGDDLTIEELKEPQDLQVGTHRLAVKLGETTLPLSDRVTLKTTEYDGEYQLAVTFDGVTAVSESFTIVKGDQRVLTISLEKLALPEPADHAASAGEQASGAVAQIQMDATSAQTLNPDLTVTSFLLGIGGSVGVLVGESSPQDSAAKMVRVSPHATFSVPAHYRQITAHADVPQEAFSIHTMVYPSGTRVDDLSHLAGLKELHTIVMEGTQPSDRALNTLPRPNTVKVLILRDAKIDATNLLGLSGWSQLEHLDLYGVLLRGRRIQDADLAILREFPELGFLDLGRVEITDADIDTLVQCRKLHWLGIAPPKMTDQGLGKLRELKLRALYIKSDLITDAGMAYLPDFHELTEVGIEFPRVTDAGMRNIASMVDRLRILHISPTKEITDEGLRILENANNLFHLSLGPQVTDRGLTYLRNCKLRYLNLEACNVSDAWLPQLEKMTTLETLILGTRAKVSESALSAFRAKLPACQIQMPPAQPPRGRRRKAKANRKLPTSSKQSARDPEIPIDQQCTILPPDLTQPEWKQELVSCQSQMSSEANPNLKQIFGSAGRPILLLRIFGEEPLLPPVKFGVRSGQNVPRLDLELIHSGGGYSSVQTVQQGGFVRIRLGSWRPLDTPLPDEIAARVRLFAMHHYSPELTLNFRKGQVVAVGDVVLKRLPESRNGRLQLLVLAEDDPAFSNGSIELSAGRQMSLPFSASGVENGQTVWVSPPVGAGDYSVEIGPRDRWIAPPRKVTVIAGQTSQEDLSVYRQREVTLKWWYRVQNSKRWSSGVHRMKTGEYWTPRDAWGGVGFPVLRITAWDGTGCGLRSVNFRAVPINEFSDPANYEFPSAEAFRASREYAIQVGAAFALQRDDSQAIVRVERIARVDAQ